MIFFSVIFDASGLLGGITNNGKRMTKGDEFDGFKVTIKIKFYELEKRLVKMTEKR